MLGCRVRVSKELHAFIAARSQEQGISPELMIERLVVLAFPGEFVGMLETSDERWIPDTTVRPVGAGLLAIDGGMSQRLG